jgi:CelD/BcsL family acetyltransferase involved in cellulose biosynthesis
VADITLTAVADLGNLVGRWQALEAESAPGPFRTWHFIGRQAVHFSAPFLLAVREAGQDKALALLNRAGRRMFLHETGDAAIDALFIEHNGLLVRCGAEHVLAPALRFLAASGPVALSGVDDAHLAAASAAGVITRHQPRFAPAVDLAALRGRFLDTLSGNARAQIRRAMRLAGPDLAIHRAADGATALAYFDDLVALHQAAWRARGHTGAFADARMLAFHAALIKGGGLADVLRVTAAGRTLGVLYMLRQGGHVCCYQSGFASFVNAREKPGMVSHALAIELYRSEGATTYDLLAGHARYKTTLAPAGGQMLHWFTLHPAGALGARARNFMARKKKVFFFEKKNQKTFIRGRTWPLATCAHEKKFFGSFFQKRTLLPSLAFDSRRGVLHRVILPPHPHCMQISAP